MRSWLQFGVQQAAALLAFLMLISNASANLLLNPGFEDVAGLPLGPGSNITGNQGNPFTVPNWQKTGVSQINLVRVDGPGGSINYGNLGRQPSPD